MSPDDVGVFTAALFAPKNLKILGILMAVALFVPGVPFWHMAGLAAFVYTVKVFKTAANPDFARQALGEAEYVRGERRELPRAAGTAPKLQGRYLELTRRAHAALDEMRRQLGTVSEPFLKQQLDGVRPQFEGMVERVETLCAAAQELSSRGADGGKLTTEIAELEAKAAAAADEETRRHYEGAIESKRKVLENSDWFQKTASRMEAELVGLDGAIDRLRSDVTRVVASSLTGGGGGGEAQRELTGLTTQMAAIEAAVTELETLKAEDRRLASRSRVT